jgi:hypothetical protein
MMMVMITGLRKGEFGLLLSFLDCKPGGHMEFMAPAERENLYRIQQVVSEDDKFIYIEPIKCRVKYRNLTKAGFLRIPSFVKKLKRYLNIHHQLVQLMINLEIYMALMNLLKRENY